jgi:hypothetical protein
MCWRIYPGNIVASVTESSAARKVMKVEMPNTNALARPSENSFDVFMLQLNTLAAGQMLHSAMKIKNRDGLRPSLCDWNKSEC